MIDGREALLKLILHTARFSGLAPLARPLVGGIGAILMLHRVTALPERAVDLNAHLAVEPAFLDKLLSAMKRDRSSLRAEMPFRRQGAAGDCRCGGDDCGEARREAAAHGLSLWLQECGRCS